jgi:hypothetical protein
MKQRFRVWHAKSNSVADSWAIQDATGKIQVARTLRVKVETFFPSQDLEGTPKAWAEIEGVLKWNGNGNAVIE